MNAWAIRPVIDRRRWHRWFWDGLSRGSRCGDEGGGGAGGRLLGKAVAQDQCCKRLALRAPTPIMDRGGLG